MMWIRVFVGCLVLGLGLAVPELALTRSNGAPAGFAGDILTNGQPQTCATGCHASFALNDPSGGGSVTIDAPETVAPGETITITVSVVNNTPTTGTREQGFLVTVKDPDIGDNGTFAGSFTISDVANTRLAAGSDDHVTHTSAGTAQTSWSFDWTAPATDAPAQVVIYAAGNAANGTGSTTGDYIYTDTHTISMAGVAVEGGPQADIGVDWAAVVPNPVLDRARAELVLAEPMEVVVRLVDGRGRLVRVLASGERPRGVSAVEMDVHGLAPGAYFLVAETAMGQRTEAVSVVR